MIVRALVTLLALTNRILVVCYVKIVGRNVLFSFSDMFLCLTLEFFFICSVYYFDLTRLISLSIIFYFFWKILLLVLSGG